MPGGRGEGNDRGICALLEYRKRREAPVNWRLEPIRRALPAAMIAACVIPVRSRVVARTDDDDWGRVVAIVVGLSVSVIVRSIVIWPADDHLAGEVRVSETQRDADPGLSAGAARSETKQQTNENEHAFHGCLLVVSIKGRAVPRSPMLVSDVLSM